MAKTTDISQKRGDMADEKREDQNDFPRGVSQPALRALQGAGYTRLEQLTTVTEADLLKLHGMGPKALGVLRDALQARGLSFAKAQ